MIFSSPPWVQPVAQQAPDSIPVGDFVLARKPAAEDKAPFLDALSGHSYSIETLQSRVDNLARGLAHDLDWSPNTGSPWDKVVAIHSLNTIDYFVLCWAIHRLNGICLPLHSSCTADEIKTHMSTARCQIIFTCKDLESTCLEAVAKLLIPRDRVYSLDQAETTPDHAFSGRSVQHLITKGSKLDPLEPLIWKPGQGKSQIAFLCATSGTSGKQKLAMLSHYGLITNVLQMTAFESFVSSTNSTGTGAIPFSHSYGLLIGHLGVWRGDCLIVFPRFDMQLMLSSVAKYNIDRLYLVPPILAALAANPFLLDYFNLSSVTSVVTGAAALDRVIAEKLHSLQPKWNFLHAWGLTETCIVVTLTSAHDVWHGSSGSLLPGCQLRLVDPNDKEIDNYDEAGEVLYRAANIFNGYLGDEESTKKTFDGDGWMRTGDVGEMRVSPNGTEHLFIRDRIKDMIKVKGMQVVPADIESVLILHPAVADAAVIGVPDNIAGERPLAFVVRSESAMVDLSAQDVQDSIDDHVEGILHETHWLNGRIEFVSAIPKSQSGKVLKRELRDTLSAKKALIA